MLERPENELGIVAVGGLPPENALENTSPTVASQNTPSPRGMRVASATQEPVRDGRGEVACDQVTGGEARGACLVEGFRHRLRK
ncbi:hypothetical protein ACFPK1_12560 [Actinomycetospora rhizophila]|uniref:Uncharacterized protein n=1 Tax=Actinomycetospora rhizophila TaxID=1416876 RepID=A0ABV9ZEQ3_9PSEU